MPLLRPHQTIKSAAVGEGITMSDRFTSLNVANMRSNLLGMCFSKGKVHTKIPRNVLKFKF